MYCGIDVIEVERIKDAILNTSKFKESIFTNQEIEEIEKCADKIKYQRYAGRFAAKEAVFKAICEALILNNLTINLNEIEIINIENLKRKPKVNFLNENVKELIKDYNIDVSITHIESIAQAICIVNKK